MIKKPRKNCRKRVNGDCKITERPTIGPQRREANVALSDITHFYVMKIIIKETLSFIPRKGIFLCQFAFYRAELDTKILV